MRTKRKEGGKAREEARILAARDWLAVSRHYSAVSGIQRESPTAHRMPMLQFSLVA